MGAFRVSFEIGTPQGTRFETVGGLVDTGAAYTWMPGELLRRLGVAPNRTLPFGLADGTVIERDIGETRVRLNGRELTTLVVFGDEASVPLLGAYTLEGFALAVDPVNRRLVPVTVLPMA
jgi:clan AA aspartic protease